MTLVRKATWKNKKTKENYFKYCDKIQQIWEEKGPQLLHPKTRNNEDKKDGAHDDEKLRNISSFGEIDNPIGEEISKPYGIYLFKDRNTIINYFKPNFFPPYNTDKNRNIIDKILSKTWDEKNLRWIFDK